jgi:hypothetical protein
MAKFAKLDEQHKTFMDALERDFVSKRGAEEWLFVGPWVEEIFADVIGAWIGGKRFLIAGQELIKQKIGLETEPWTENDYEHVPDALRPWIASYTLQKQDPANNGDATAAWSGFLGTFPINIDDLIITIETEEPTPLERLLGIDKRKRKRAKELVPALQCIVDYLLTGIEKFRFDFVFSVAASVDELKTRAQKAAIVQKREAEAQHDTEAAQAVRVYKALLQPMVIEAEQSGTKHQHTYYTYIPHFHKDKPRSHRHT